MRDSRGFSLVEAMIAGAVLAITMGGFSSMMINQQRETRALNEKLAWLAVKNLLTAALADGTVCSYILNHPTQLTFNSSSPMTIAAASIEIGRIPANASPTAPNIAVARTQAAADSKTLWIDSINLKNFSGSGTNFTADWVIDFDQRQLVRPIGAISIPMTLVVDNTSPSFTKIVSCMNAGAGGAPVFYDIAVPRNSSNEFSTLPLIHSFCALSQVKSGGDNGGGNDRCQVTYDSGTGIWKLSGRRGNDPEITCSMICK